MVDIEIYETEDGRRPFSKWFESLRSERARAEIYQAQKKIEAGKPGNIKTVDGPIKEYRISRDKGYRILFAYYEQTLVVLLGGCTKDNKKEQREAIEAAKRCWEDYLQRKERSSRHEESQ